MSVYVVDSNVFIQAHRINYPLDIAHSFWNKFKQLACDGTIVSIDKVKNEIFKNEDDLKQWCSDNLPGDFFKDSAPVINQYSQVVKWAQSKISQYLPNALQEFLSADEADAFLIAYALADPGIRIVVTHEISKPLGRNKIKIPDVCEELNVQYVGVMEMFRQLGVTF